MKFKVGQFVKIVSKAISRIVEVVEVNPTTVCVQTVDGCRHLFNKDGKQCKPDGEPYVEHDFRWTLPEPDTYTLCHDEVRKVHRLDCDCDECWKHRAGVTRKRDGEFIGHYIKDFAELTEQEIFDKLQEGERVPCNWNYGGEAYYRWRIGLRARGSKWREEVVKYYL